MGSAICCDFGAQRARFVLISVRSTFGSSRFQQAAPAVRRFLRVGRTFCFALASRGFASGEHAVSFRLRRACGGLVHVESRSAKIV